MRGWNHETQWVTDIDGLRWYFSERDPGGPSRLECYRRLLGEPADVPPPPSFLAAHLRAFATLLELAKRNWRNQPIVQHE
jgi:hypothetical protein